MKQERLASTPAWRRGALLLAAMALLIPVIQGCSNDTDVTGSKTDSMFSPTDEVISLGVAPDFCPNLPPDPVVVIHTQPGATSLFDIWFWGTGVGYDIETNDTLPGWCIEDVPLPNVQDPGRVTLYCSYDDALPGNLGDLPIDQINYMLNNRIGEPMEVQVAIWLLLGYSEPSKPATENSYAMLEDALANGAGFVPGPGELVAIMLYTGDGGIGPEGYQETIVEMRIPGEPGGDACTPGYWKTHFDRWPEGYDPFDDFDTVFGTDYFDSGLNLGDATWSGGGGLDKLARHGTSALLNAAHGDVEYPYTTAEVIDMVRAGDADTLADTNDADELDCPLGGSSADPGARFESEKKPRPKK